MYGYNPLESPITSNASGLPIKSTDRVVLDRVVLGADGLFKCQTLTA